MKYALPLLFALSPATLANEQACQPIDEAQVAALFDRWNADVQTGDPQRVVENYARDSMLLPTVSNTPRQTPEAKLDYFQHFLALKPKGEIVSRMVMIDCNSALDTGLYSRRGHCPCALHLHLQVVCGCRAVADHQPPLVRDAGADRRSAAGSAGRPLSAAHSPGAPHGSSRRAGRHHVTADAECTAALLLSLTARYS